jgi:hyperosmotically inducible protein
MRIWKAGVLAGTMWVSTALMSVPEPALAHADDRAEIQKDRTDRHAKDAREQTDQHARHAKPGDARAQANKDPLGREESARTKPPASDDVTDAWITTKVKASFGEDKSLKGSDIRVETAERGVVVLSGYVPNNTARVRAISLAWDTKGVKKVDDQLQLKAAP